MFAAVQRNSASTVDVTSKVRYRRLSCGSRLAASPSSPATSASRIGGSIHSGADGVSLFLGGLEDTVRCKKWFFGSLHLDRAITTQRVSVFEHVLPVDPPEKKSGARHAK